MVPSDISPTAPFEGAKRVNGPFPFQVSTNLAALMAVTKVVREGSATAVSKISNLYEWCCVASELADTKIKDKTAIEIHLVKDTFIITPDSVSDKNC